MGLARLATLVAAAMMASSSVAVARGSQYSPRARDPISVCRQSAAGFTATHVNSHRLVAHDKRDATKARNVARHKRAMKRRGR